MAEMSEVAAGAPELHGDALRRTDAALALRRPPEPADREAIEARFDAILAGAVAA
jgi:beta-N-acetylhexosaminidase